MAEALIHSAANPSKVVMLCVFSHLIAFIYEAVYSSYIVGVHTIQCTSICLCPRYNNPVVCNILHVRAEWTW